MDFRIELNRTRALGGAAAHLLFERLPDRLFLPLATESRFQYWTLLCALHRHRFGPEAPLTPSDGFTHRDISRKIEEVLRELDWNPVEIEGADDPATPLNVRANGILQRLVDCGWLREDRHGLEKRITMAPAVSQFLSDLVRFAETGPVFVAGKIRSIELNVNAVADGAEGDSLAEAADSARNLIEHIRNTGLNVRDVMNALTPELATGEYVRRLFKDYIKSIFIGDYGELRTREHPLARRQQILDTLERKVCSPENYARLIGWYKKNMANDNEVDARRLLERNLDRIRELSRIDEYLERLDEEIRRANKQAVAFLDYRVRALRPVDAIIDSAINSLLRVDCDVAVPFSPGSMISPESLAEPRIRAPKLPADALRRAVPTETDIARMHLKMRAREARQVTPLKLRLFLRDQLNDRAELTSDQLRIESVSDLVSKQALALNALAMKTKSEKQRRAAQANIRGHDLNLDVEAIEPEGTALRGHVLHITKRSP
jgi:hypothetical protein